MNSGVLRERIRMWEKSSERGPKRKNSNVGI